MCGILCVLGIHGAADGEAIRAAVLARARRIRHRGPDWGGIYFKKNAILAHERLAIVDVTSGSQPLVSPNEEIVLVVNGEIYNHKSIRSECISDGNFGEFRTNSDCEPIINLYQRFGPGFLNQLNGIFSFVLVDEKNDSFLIARDHVGIVSLYWGRDKHGHLWVSSELKAIADICITFEDFPPGHYYWSVTGKTVKWYNPSWTNEREIPTTPVDLTKLRQEFEAAVHRQLMSDVPFGVLLSGGLDSSLVASIASRIKRMEDSKQPAWPHLHSFSIGLKESPDLKAAKKVADYLGTVHHQFVFTLQEGLDALSDVIYHLETYDVTTVRAATPMYLLSRKIKAMGIKMVLSGEGADEVFGGYLYFHKCPSREEFQKESVNKVKGLYKFDCLRANKSTAAWGVEARVPFLDKDFLNYAMTIDPADKMCGPKGKQLIEKYIVRKAFEGYLPDEILWRQKEQFSDGVGYSWIDGLQNWAKEKISDRLLAAAKFRFPHNPPPTKEAYLIREIFESYFPQEAAAKAVPGGPSVACSTPAAILWDKSFKEFADCSGRSIAGVHTMAYDGKRRAEVSHATLHKEKEKAESKQEVAISLPSAPPEFETLLKPSAESVPFMGISSDQIVEPAHKKLKAMS